MAFLSQRSIQGVAQPLVFSLAKFSYATCSADLNGPINWTHLPDRDNLHAVFDYVRVQEMSGRVVEKKVLKVVRGPETMEDLDLHSLAQESVSGEKLNIMNDPSFQSPVLVIVRPPCIAIRYPLETRQSRRFQMRFQTDPDYYKALTALSEAGFLLKQASATAPGTRPASSMQNRPLTSSSVNRDEVKKSESQSSYTIQTIPPAVKSQHYGYAPSTGAPIHPSIYGQTVPEFLKPTSSSSSCTITSAIAPKITPQIFHPESKITPAYALPTLLSPTSGNQASTKFPTRQSFDGFLKSDARSRPATAPTDDLTISQCMPPIRELPFNRPVSHQSPKSGYPSSPNKTSHTASSVQNDLNLVQIDEGKKPGLQATKPRKQAKSSVPSVEDLLKISTLAPCPHSERRLTGIASKSSPHEALDKASNQATNSRKRSLQEPEGSIEPFTKRPTTNYEKIVDGHASIAPSTSVSMSMPPLRESGSKVNAANALREYPHSHPPSTPTVPVDPWGGVEMNLDAFVAKGADERQAEIEDWICRQLLDPNFKTLCEEVESCWKRVFLGER